MLCISLSSRYDGRARTVGTESAGGRMTGDTQQPRTGSAFLLAQLGAHAAAGFAARIAALDLTPAQAGLLRLMRTTSARRWTGPSARS
jgi:hypothetical protein